MLTPSLVGQLGRFSKHAPAMFGVCVVLIVETALVWSGQMSDYSVLALGMAALLVLAIVYVFWIARSLPQPRSSEVSSASAGQAEPWATWSGFDAAVDNTVRSIEKDQFSPDLVVFLGRSGAIFGGAIAGNLGVPRTAILDRYVETQGHDVIRDEIVHHIEPESIVGKRILVVKGEVSSGRSMGVARDLLRGLGAADIKLAAYHASTQSKVSIDYPGFSSPAGVISTPWRRTDRWVRRTMPAYRASPPK